jgi:hypothetical protein
MKKLTIILIISIALLGCELEPEYEFDDYENEAPSGSSYPTYSEYVSLLDKLQSESAISRTVINQKLTELDVTLSYDYDYYVSGDYVCYTFNWSYWSSYSFDFLYYIVVDIWTASGSFNRSMCSYYNG